MEIRDNIFDNRVAFELVKEGHVFKLGDSYMMKIESVDDTVLGTLNAVCLNDGLMVRLCDDTLVYPINGHFVVED